MITDHDLSYLNHLPDLIDVSTYAVQQTQHVEVSFKTCDNQIHVPCSFGLLCHSSCVLVSCVLGFVVLL